MTRMPRYLDLQESDLPLELDVPAERALCQAGISCLDELTAFSESDIKRLDGVGPRMVGTLRSALAEKGLSFAQSRHEQR